MILWSDQYAPQELSQIIGNEEIIPVLDSYASHQSLLNLIFTGPNGVGKTTTAHLLIKAYLGQYSSKATYQVMGSINRGKDKVSDRESDSILNFIKRSLPLPKNLCKVVMIDDFQSMTSEAQMALRRVMELYASKARFIFICEDLTGVMEAIQSRCLIMRFKSFTCNQISDRLKQICPHFSEELYSRIALISNGDLKQAINYLQVSSGSNNSDLNLPDLDLIDQMMSSALSGKVSESLKVLQTLYQSGYNSDDLLDLLTKWVIYQTDLDKAVRVHTIELITQIYLEQVKCPSDLHLYSYLCQLAKRVVHS